MRQRKKSFFAVQCNKQNKSLSQQLSATNHIEKIFNFLLACDKGIGNKAKHEHPFQFEFQHRYQIALGYLVGNVAYIKVLSQQKYLDINQFVVNRAS